MTGPTVINQALYAEDQTTALQYKFNNGVPIRHLVIDNFLNEDIAHAIFTHFPALAAMKTRYHGLNENKSESSAFEQLPGCFTQLHEGLSSASFLRWLKACTGIDDFTTIPDRLGYGLHQGGNHSFLDIHIDYNIHPIQKLYRKINLILFFNPQWEDAWGGHLELWDSEVKNCIQRIAPVFNRCVLFECSDVSYHGYSKLTIPENITRKSYYQYYFIPLEEHIVFHDTVFKPRPSEPLLKKILTPVKEFSKNTAKRILLTLGMERYLK